MDCPACQTNDWNGRRRGCDVHVGCDDLACEALVDPQTYGELAAALDHWREHEFAHGCSHGA